MVTSHQSCVMKVIHIRYQNLYYKKRHLQYKINDTVFPSTYIEIFFFFFFVEAVSYTESP